LDALSATFANGRDAVAFVLVRRADYPGLLWSDFAPGGSTSVTEKISALRTEIYFHERAACAWLDEARLRGMEEALLPTRAAPLPGPPVPHALRDQAEGVVRRPGRLSAIA
jgi:hypothetical protein